MSERDDVSGASADERMPEAGRSRDLQRMDLGGMALLVPLTRRAFAWLVRECHIEAWQTVMVNGCEGVAVEHRLADEIMGAWEAAR